ncbi:zinc-binding dehydrogenase domain-containing protein [Sarocladium implicatum]|nr:zinc-binding dehydrogenase domain-containing protein [Sarocladium implicatum]
MSIPSSFKGCEIRTPKSQTSIVTRTLSALGPKEVGIKITATAINPVDWKMRDYDIFLKEYPAVLGSDAAGVVAAIGSDINDFKVGDRVFFQGIIGKYESSTFQEYCKMPAELVAKTPSNVTDEEAAGVSLATMAAVVGLYTPHQGNNMTPPWEKGGDSVGKGKSIVVIGGSSSVGQYAIQLARLSGFERIITNASSSNHDHLKSLGAHVVLDRSDSSPEAFAKAMGNYPLEVVFDSISAAATQMLGVQTIQAAKTANAKTLVTAVYAGVPEKADPEAVKQGEKSEPKIEITQILGLGSAPYLRAWSEPLLKALGGEDGYIGRGLYKPNRPRLIAGGLGAIEEAMELNKKGVSGEKVVVRVADP